MSHTEGAQENEDATARNAQPHESGMQQVKTIERELRMRGKQLNEIQDKLQKAQGRILMLEKELKEKDRLA